MQNHGSFIDLTGKTFGHLKVLKFLKKTSGTSVWKCLCECGEIAIKYRTNLIQQKHISCGCKANEYRKLAVSLPKGEASFNEIYRAYKYRAKLGFKLSKKRFKELTSENCHYCNSAPSSKFGTHEKRNNGIYIYNGIDRVDNNKGYTISNVVTCCGICNKMKLAMSAKDFLTHIEKIHRNQHEQKI